MKEKRKSFVENKKSKFYGYLYEISDVKDVENILKELKFEHKKAKHIVYAYKINNIEKKYEDKEPAGTSGSVILDLINLKELNNTLIIIVRYFGGILLGRGLLTRSYRETAKKLFD